MPGVFFWITNLTRGSRCSHWRQIEKVSSEARGEVRRRISWMYPRSRSSSILIVSSIENVSENTVTTMESLMVLSGTLFCVMESPVPSEFCASVKSAVSISKSPTTRGSHATVVARPRPPDGRDIHQHVQYATRHHSHRRRTQDASPQANPHERDQEVEKRAGYANPFVPRQS